MLVVCISCVKTKRRHVCRAEELYTSPLFRLSLMYARSLEPDMVFILSAKYGLLRLDDVVEPYEQTLNAMPKVERLAWADRVLAQLRSVVALESDTLVLLCGAKYREHLVPYIRHAKVPLKGMSLGQQLSWLKKAVG